MKIQLLFPMGGLGTRFANVGIMTPKPLILVDGVPMIVKAVSSFANLLNSPSSPDIDIIFIVRVEHEEKFGLKTELEKVFAKEKADGHRVSTKFVMMSHDTRGAVETCLLAADVIDEAAPLVVMDCDLYFRSAAYEQILLDVATGKAHDIGGVLVHFNSRAPRYSYALTDEHGTVIKTAEKVPISDKSLIGAYGFGSGKIFIEAGRKLLEAPIDPAKGMKEYYVSLLYNMVIASGLRVLAVPRDEYASFGTPEELDNYNKGLPSYVTE